MKRMSVVLAAVAALFIVLPAGTAHAGCGSDSDRKGGSCSGGKCSNRDQF